MSELFSFLTNNPLLSLICGILLLVIVISLIKAAFKVAIILVVIFICAVVVFDIQNPQDVSNKGAEKITEEIQKEIKIADY